MCRFAVYSIVAQQHQISYLLSPIFYLLSPNYTVSTTGRIMGLRFVVL